MKAGAAKRLYDAMTPALVRQEVDMPVLLDRYVPASGRGVNLGSKAVRLENPEKPGFTWTNIDIVAGPGVDIVCDAIVLSQHEQFKAGADRDVVVVSAMLQYVGAENGQDAPKRVVQQIAHVLKPGGIVISNTPFLQQVCPEPGSLDRNRFPPERLRELYGEQFDILEMGVAVGVWSAIATMVRSAADQASPNRYASALLRFVAGWGVAPLVYLPPGGIDTAGALYLVGRRK